MYELPELMHLRDQINKYLTGKAIQEGYLGNTPHKFVWYNQTHEDFSNITSGKVIMDSYVRGRWLFISLDADYIMVFGEFGGKFYYSNEFNHIPDKYHLLLKFQDKNFLSLMIQMWGAIELYRCGEELKRKYIKDMKPDPLDPSFTEKYFRELIYKLRNEGKRSIKGLLTQDQLLPGIGNSTAQEIMFKAKLNPKRDIRDLDNTEVERLYHKVLDTIQEIYFKDGREDEIDLFGKKGRYIRLMSSAVAGKPCPVCGTEIKKIQYLGGACVFCPDCQK